MELKNSRDLFKFYRNVYSFNVGKLDGPGPLRLETAFRNLKPDANRYHDESVALHDGLDFVHQIGRSGFDEGQRVLQRVVVVVVAAAEKRHVRQADRWQRFPPGPMSVVRRGPVVPSGGSRVRRTATAVSGHGRVRKTSLDRPLRGYAETHARLLTDRYAPRRVFYFSYSSPPPQHSNLAARTGAYLVLLFSMFYRTLLLFFFYHTGTRWMYT